MGDRINQLKSAEHGLIWRLALPIALSNLSVPLVGAVDTAVIGRLNEPSQLGALALGAIIFSFVYWGFGFLRMGTTGFVSQAFGRDDDAGIHATCIRSVTLAVALGITIWLFQAPLLALSLNLAGGNEEISTAISRYYGIRIWSAPAVLIQYIAVGFLIGIQRPLHALWIQIWLNSINIVLDLVFVVGFGLGIEGVAAATLISEVSAAGLALFLMQRTRLVNLGRLIADFELSGMWRLLKVNSDLMIRTIALLAGFAWFDVQSLGISQTTLAANAILLQFMTFAAHGLDAFAHTSESLVGAAWGRRDRDSFRSRVLACTLWAFAVALAVSTAYLLAGDRLVGLFTSHPEVVAVARAHLAWVIWMPLVSVLSYQMDGIFIGVTRSKEMRDAMLVSLLVYIAACELLVPLLANTGLWLALTIFMLARGLSLGYRYFGLVRELDSTGQCPA